MIVRFFIVLVYNVSARAQVYNIPRNLKAALRWMRCVSVTHLHITEESGRPKIDSCAIIQGLQKSKAERISAWQWMLLKPGAVLLCSKMPIGMFQLQTDLSGKGHELFSQCSGSFSMGFDRESQLIKSYFTIKHGSISLSISVQLVFSCQLASVQNSLYFFNWSFFLLKKPLFIPINAS